MKEPSIIQEKSKDGYILVNKHIYLKRRKNYLRTFTSLLFDYKLNSKSIRKKKKEFIILDESRILRILFNINKKLLFYSNKSLRDKFKLKHLSSKQINKIKKEVMLNETRKS